MTLYQLASEPRLLVTKVSYGLSAVAVIDIFVVQKASWFSAWITVSVLRTNSQVICSSMFTGIFSSRLLGPLLWMINWSRPLVCPDNTVLNS